MATEYRIMYEFHRSPDKFPEKEQNGTSVLCIEADEPLNLEDKSDLDYLKSTILHHANAERIGIRNIEEREI